MKVRLFRERPLSGPDGRTLLPSKGRLGRVGRRTDLGRVLVSSLPTVASGCSADRDVPRTGAARGREDSLTEQEAT